jgi:uncharacterized RDD family membrane protein YckC
MKFHKIEPKPHLKLRILATLIDYGIYMIFFYVYLYVFNENPEPGKMTVTGILTLPLVIVWFAYFVVLESANGATPGHDICKLKVVKENGDKLTIGSAFKRRICDFIDVGLYGIPALICISKTPKHQRLGDLLANTLVVKSTDVIETEVTF